MNQQSNGTENQQDTDTPEQPPETDHPEAEEALEGDDSAEPSSAEQASELTLEEQLQAALDEAEKLRDASIRAVAEQENQRRRAQRDVQNARKYGSEKLLRELLAVVDGLEAALASEESGGEGVKMTLELLLKTFEQHDVVALSPQGEAFNPDLHQAMTMQPSDEVAPNHVLQVIQKGYQLHDRLLRPAMVVVAKAPEESGETD
ncbi:MAG: nucleotide exchange factor GrpE [Gammaproteobacteria bacterium]